MNLSDYEKTHAVDYDAIARKMSKANYPTLISTLKAMRNDLENNPHIKLDDLGLARLMASCESRTTNPGHFTNSDYSVLMKVLYSLAQIIVTGHLAELMSVKKGKKPKSPLEGLTMKFDTWGRWISLDIRTRGVHELFIDFKEEDSLHSLITSTALPFYYHCTDPGYVSRVILGKIVLDLISIEDWSIDSIQSYSESQHDWVLSSIVNAMMVDANASSCRPNEMYGSIDKRKQLFIMMVTTSLLHGCQLGEEDDEMMEMVNPLDVSYSGRRGLRSHVSFIDSVMGMAGKIFPSDCFDSNVISMSFSYGHPNSVERIYSYDDVSCGIDRIKRGSHQWRVVNGNYTDPLNIGLKSSDPMIKPSYHRRVDGAFPLTYDRVRDFIDGRAGKSNIGKDDRDRNYCVPQLPASLRRVVDRDFIMGLQAKTRFITRHLMEKGSLYSITTADAIVDRRLGVEDPIGNLSEIARNRCTLFHTFAAPFFLHPREEEGEYVRFKYNPVVERPDYGVTGDVVEGRVLTKLYGVHQLIHIPEVMVDLDTEISPLESIVISDVISACDRAFVDDVVVMDRDSNCYKALVRRCMEVYDSSPDLKLDSKGLGDMVELEKIDDLSWFYGKMASGEGLAGGLEGLFQRMDNAIIDAVVDYYVEAMSGEGSSSSSMPWSFMVENLRMNVIGRYEDLVFGG